MTTSQTVAVLGLGHMGSAMAVRLGGGGRVSKVVGWTRSGRGVKGVTVVAELGEAVAEADIVVLALFDGAACRQVLDQVRGLLKSGAVVVNTSTVAPAEAAEFAALVGPGYVHAPVLGSVPSVGAGSLRILAAAEAEAFERCEAVLGALGSVTRVEDAARAAALKLVANASLAGAVLVLRDALQQADALGLTRNEALDVLEFSHLSSLVARKRAYLVEPATKSATADAQFTIGALAKDMAVLADASHRPLPSVAELIDAAAVPDADIAVAVTVPAVDDAVLAPLRAYIRGHATGDPGHFREAFRDSAHIEGVRDGRFVSWMLDEYCDLFTGKPADDEATRRRRIDSVRVHGSVASASMTLWHGPDTFTDIFLLAAVDGEWRIANKAYYRH